MDWAQRFRRAYRGELERRGVKPPRAVLAAEALARAEASASADLLGEPDVGAKAMDPLEAFVIANTAVAAPPLVPEIRLHLATEITPLWEATETQLAEQGLPPPFWAFSWPGGQALARILLDRPSLVAGLRVLDFAAGCGVAAIAARRAGAARVVATEIDPFAGAALSLNAWLADADIEIWIEDVIGRDLTPSLAEGFDVVLIGDMCYEKPLAERMTRWLRGVAAGGTLVLLGDPGRSYLPKEGLEPVTAFSVPTTLELESATIQNTKVWRLLP